MFKNKKQNNQYGTFALAKKRFSKLRQTSILTILVVVLILGLAGILFKYGSKPNPKQVADTKPLDQIPGWWQQQYFGSSVCEKDICQDAADPDKDGLNNLQEFYYHTDPLNPKTVGDKLNDGQLVAQGFDPSKPGEVTFDQASAPESLLGESLVFDSDIRQMVAESNDISKVNLPLVSDDQLQIVYGESDAVYKTYSSKLQATLNKYFPQSNLNSIEEILKSGSDAEVTDIKTKAEAVAMELKTIPMPVRFMIFHKYNIAMFQLLSEIIPAPANTSSTLSDAWYDKVQAFLAVQQKLSFEEQRLKQAPGAQP